MYKFIQKTIDWGVKIASLAITAPATWIVATQLFTDIQSPVLLFVMRFAAVFLIEGVLLSNWVLLEFDKSAAPEIKARYGITAMTMYVMLLVIAWRHEGPTGLVFRVALLAALVASGWDTYVYTWQRMTASIDRSPENSPKVRRHARNLSIKEAMLRRDSEHQTELAMIAAHTDTSLLENKLNAERRIEEIQLDDRRQRHQLLADGEELDSQSNGKKKPFRQLQPPYPPVVSEARTMGAPSYRDSSQESLQLRHNILDALGEDRKYYPETLAQKFGVGPDQVDEQLDELEQDGVIGWKGKQVVLTNYGESRTNGGRIKTKSRK